MPVASIIIPCYNQGAFLAESAGSALAQTLVDTEVIIVDDGSTEPETQRALAAFRHPRARVVRSANQGLAAARNLGITQATGRYILPLDCDDRIAPTYLEKAVALLEADPALGIVYCQAEFFGQQGGPWLLPPYRFPESIFQPALFCSGVFRRSDWQEAGGYNADMIHGYEDHDFWLALIKRDRKVRQIEEPLFFYRRTATSMVQAITLEQKVASFMRMFAHHRELFIDNIATLFHGFLAREATSQVRHLRPLLQVFFGAAGGYNETDSCRVEYAAGEWVEVALPCPHPLRPGPEPVRLDPGMQSGCYDLAGLRWIEAGTAGPWINLTAAPVQARVAGTALRLPAVDFLRVFSFGTDPQVILTGLTVPTGATALQVRLRYHPEIDMAADSFAKLAASGPMRG